jgi:hypothetical protein
MHFNALKDSETGGFLTVSLKKFGWRVTINGVKVSINNAHLEEWGIRMFTKEDILKNYFTNIWRRLWLEK